MNSNNFSLSSNPLCTFCQSNSNQARKHIFDQVIFKICTIFGQWSDGFAIQKYREMIDFRLQLSLFAFSVKIIEIVWFKSLSLHKWLNFKKKKISNQSKFLGQNFNFWYSVPKYAYTATPPQKPLEPLQKCLFREAEKSKTQVLNAQWATIICHIQV